MAERAPCAACLSVDKARFGLLQLGAGCALARGRCDGARPVRAYVSAPCNRQCMGTDSSAL